MDDRDLELSHLTDAELMALYAVIGRLVVEYARAETYVNLLARHLLGNDHAGLIVFSGMRLGDLTDRIRGMLRVNQATEQDCADIDACLVQLDLIGKVRQKLTHRYVGLQAPELIQTHNLYTAKTPEGEEIAEFTPGQLNEMISDCIRIRRRILRHTDGEARRRERHDPDWIPKLFAPWRYRPLAPIPPTKARRAIPPK